MHGASREAVSTARCLALAFVLWSSHLRERRGSVCPVTTEPNHPGPGRSTADAALIARKKEIAQRNERAQQEARKLRAAREQELVRRRRQDDIR
jgi:hypothetical protein